VRQAVAGHAAFQRAGLIQIVFRTVEEHRAVADQLPRPHLDLRFCVERALREAGVPAERIEQVEGCTSCDTSAFFSHRREKGHTGRYLAFIQAR